MENYTYPPYPESSESSPRSREVDFENPPPWDEQQPPPTNYKAKFMCSYGGKIQPRSHDNQLSYVGGDTKILAVDRNIKFPAFLSKLAALCDCASPENLTLKYQLPGEDLDALISVTTDDDLDHMMHEYDRLFRASAKPARMRLFLFTASTTSAPPSFSTDRDRFVEALNSGPVPVQPDPVKPPPVAPANVDFLFGLEKAAPPPPQPAPPLATVKFHDPVPEPVAPPPEYQTRAAVNDRVIGSDPTVNPIDVQRQLQQELQRLQIAEADQSMYRRRSEDGFAGGYGVAGGGDYYMQKMPEKVPMSNSPATVQHPGNYWPEKQFSGEGFPTAISTAPGGGDQQFYVVPAPGTFYHAPVVRPSAAPVTQGYYAVQRMNSDGYREQPVYGGAQPAKAAFSSAGATNMAQAPPVKAPGYPEGYGVVRPAGVPDNVGSAAYAQVAYDSGSGRQVYYTAPAGVMHAPQYQGIPPPVTAAGGSLGQDASKVVNKASQGSV
ncbi:uncharacterized protein LOC130968794 [Arachis stenosperma]|uniref:uncharacterized protein LOC130968794 n=1 Tax=Arachis stenosperma TaxID=217475 RepID=UPI0025ACBB22|nr:uncharacterized protein LOC130968794 [Arachis stenosperma]